MFAEVNHVVSYAMIIYNQLYFVQIYHVQFCRCTVPYAVCTAPT